MAYSTPTEAQVVSANRALVVGPPNTFKTSSLLTWPRPAHIQVFPGEKGDATIPRGLPDLKAYLWSDNPVTKTPSSQIVTEVETLTWEILGGKHGPVTSFLGDGIHKYYAYVLDMVTGGAYFKGEEFEPKLYSRSHEHFRYYIQRIMNSPVPYVGFTCWDGRSRQSR